jgi:hypothetical protein
VSSTPPGIARIEDVGLEEGRWPPRGLTGFELVILSTEESCECVTLPAVFVGDAAFWVVFLPKSDESDIERARWKWWLVREDDGRLERCAQGAVHHMSSSSNVLVVIRGLVVWKFPTCLYERSQPACLIQHLNTMQRLGDCFYLAAAHDQETVLVLESTAFFDLDLGSAYLTKLVAAYARASSVIDVAQLHLTSPPIEPLSSSSPSAATQLCRSLVTTLGPDNAALAWLACLKHRRVLVTGTPYQLAFDCSRALVCLMDQQWSLFYPLLPDDHDSLDRVPSLIACGTSLAEFDLTIDVTTSTLAPRAFATTPQEDVVVHALKLFVQGEIGSVEDLLTRVTMTTTTNY